MKLYLSSYRIPTPTDLEKLLEKPLGQTSVALITNAKDYYTKHPRSFVVGDLVKYMEDLGLTVEEINLREFNDVISLKEKLGMHDLVFAMGGNTYMLRYEMRRSKFDEVIRDLLDEGKVYAGYSAGALVAGVSIAGVELADDPRFANEVILEGLKLVPCVIFPHADDLEFAEMIPAFKKLHQDKEIIELKDSQAVIFNDSKQTIVEASL